MMMVIIWLMMVNNNLVGGKTTPLKNMTVGMMAFPIDGNHVPNHHLSFLSIFTQRAASVNGSSTCHCVLAPIALKALANCPLLCFVFETVQQRKNESNDQYDLNDD